MEKGEGLGQKTLSLPLFNVDRHVMGHVLTDGMHPAQRNDARLDGTWPRHGPPLPHTERRKQAAIARKRPSAFLGKTWKGPMMGSLPKRDQRAC